MSVELFSLAGKTALITGATGILGRHYVAAFARCGARVVVADLDGDEAAALAGDLTAESGVDAIGVALDVSDAASVAAAVAAAEERLGTIDVLINNAASKGGDLASFFAPIESYDLAVWRQIMDVNLDGAFRMAQAIGPAMVARGRGAIINVASIYGIVGPDQRIYEGSNYLDRAINTPAVYSASKAGVLGLTRHLAALWGPHGVRVNALTPGGVASGQNDVFQQRYAERTPLARMARGEEMTGAMIFLASDASSYVNGHNLVVDGGWSIW